MLGAVALPARERQAVRQARVVNPEAPKVRPDEVKTWHKVC